MRRAIRRICGAGLVFTMAGAVSAAALHDPVAGTPPHRYRRWHNSAG
jgi:hypothetical protein